MNHDNNSNSLVQIEVVTERHWADIARMRASFLNSKHCCCFFPLGVGSNVEVRASYKKVPSLMDTSAVARLKSSGNIVGFVQVILEGQPCDIHTPKAGEAYVYMLAVDPDARGQGVGSVLLKWAEALAKERSCAFLSLEVIHGNPAIELYKRKGYVVQPRGNDIVSHLCSILMVCCLMGPLICPSGSSRYCSYGRSYYMEKQLVDE